MTLSPRQRRLIVKLFAGGLSIMEIAMSYETPASTIEAVVRAAVQLKETA